jgi:uncharacterized membrane protein (DUF2068 family)
MAEAAITHASTPIDTAVDVRSSTAGLRAVATFEAFKGGLVLVLGTALLLVHSRIQDVAEGLLYHLHIGEERRFGHMLMDAATKFSDARVLTVALAIGMYSAVRFVEAWGLWNRRVWAEWFALLSGALYLPWELLKVVERVTWERVGVLVINLAVVLYMLYIRIRECRGALSCEKTVEEIEAEKTRAATAHS